MKGKKVLIGITGSIAAYKIVELVRLLIKSSAEVKVVMTPYAVNFVSPLVLSTLSHNKVMIEIFEENTWTNHVMLGRWADVFVIAPLSCNTLAKMASGVCDNFLLAVYLSATCPIIVAPAMDEDMWHHFTTQNNIKILKDNGVRIIEVEKGALASGLNGYGRMADIHVIFREIHNCFRENSFAGKKVLITSGSTHEAIDPVRFIGNHSSGKMGTALAEAFYQKGADVTVISGPSSVQPLSDKVRVINVVSAEEMYNEVHKHFEKSDIAVMAAAVADYKPQASVKEKIKKNDDVLNLQLVKTKDILASLGTEKKEHQLVVGFALETNNAKANAIEKLKNKNADLIVLNSMEDSAAGFGVDTNKVIIFDRNNNEYPSSLASKNEIAVFIVDIIEKIINKEKT